MKRVKFLFVMLFLIIFSIGCSSKIGFDEENKNPGEVENGDLEFKEEGSINRKVIYTINTALYTDNLNETVKSIRSSLNNDEWFDVENISNNSAYLEVRIKSTRVDTFINGLESLGKISNFNRTGEDISLKYEDNMNMIAALENELARLNVLYENASVDEMIRINKRISEITTEINGLKGLLKNYDSLVDYSVIKISIKSKEQIYETSFGGKIKNTFKGAWNAVVNVLKALVLVIIAIIPFLVIIIPVGSVIIIIYSYRKKKQNTNQNNLNNKQESNKD